MITVLVICTLVLIVFLAYLYFFLDCKSSCMMGLLKNGVPTSENYTDSPKVALVQKNQ